jgi:hypothetical protein
VEEAQDEPPSVEVQAQAFAAVDFVMDTVSRAG